MEISRTAVNTTITITTVNSNMWQQTTSANATQVETEMDAPITAEQMMILQSLKQLMDNYHYAHGWISLVICFFGALMNVMNMVVLTRPTMKNPVNLCLSVIAFCDMTLMMSTFVSNLLERVLFPDECTTLERWSFGYVAVQLFHVSYSVWAHCTSLWLAVVLAVARYFTLQSQSQSAMWQQLGFMIKACVITAVLCAVASLPAFLLYRISEVTLPADYPWPMQCFYQLCAFADGCNYSQFLLAPETFKFRHPLYMKDEYIMYSSLTIVLSLIGFLHKIAPCIVLTIFMALLVKTLIKAGKRHRRLLGKNNSRQTAVVTNENSVELRNLVNRSRRFPLGVKKSAKRQSSNGSGSHADKTTVTLVLVVAIFILCELPQGILLVLASSGSSGGYFYQAIYNQLGDVFDLLSMVNSSINFVLYVLMSKKFREIFCAVFLPFLHCSVGSAAFSHSAVFGSAITYSDRLTATNNNAAKANPSFVLCDRVSNFGDSESHCSIDNDNSSNWFSRGCSCRDIYETFSLCCVFGTKTQNKTVTMSCTPTADVTGSRYLTVPNSKDVTTTCNGVINAE